MFWKVASTNGVSAWFHRDLRKGGNSPRRVLPLAPSVLCPSVKTSCVSETPTAEAEPQWVRKQRHLDVAQFQTSLQLKSRNFQHIIIINNNNQEENFLPLIITNFDVYPWHIFEVLLLFWKPSHTYYFYFERKVGPGNAASVAEAALWLCEVSSASYVPRPPPSSIHCVQNLVGLFRNACRHNSSTYGSVSQLKQNVFALLLMILLVDGFLNTTRVCSTWIFGCIAHWRW